MSEDSSGPNSIDDFIVDDEHVSYSDGEEELDRAEKRLRSQHKKGTSLHVLHLNSTSKNNAYARNQEKHDFLGRESLK